MLFVFALIVSFILILLFVVNFVLTNRDMLEATFNIVIEVPYVGWSHTWEKVQFMYIIAGSILLGALVIAISTLILDTKRTLKVRSLRKELKRLQEALQHAPQYVVEKPDEEEQLPDVEEEPVEVERGVGSGSVSAITWLKMEKPAESGGLFYLAHFPLNGSDRHHILPARLSRKTKEPDIIRLLMMPSSHEDIRTVTSRPSRR